MIFLAGFLEVLFRGLVFVGLALSVGGVVFYQVALGKRAEAAQVRRVAAWISVGAAAAAAFQFLELVLTPWSLSDGGAWPWREFLQTSYAQAGLTRSACAWALCGVALWIWGRGGGRAWFLAVLASAGVMISGAWLVHGAGRLDHRAMLMSISVLHQLVSVCWVGGVIHLVAQRGVSGSEWSKLPKQFSPLALSCVALLTMAGLYLYWHYVHDLGGLIGTAYGTMLLTKITLMLCALALGASNFILIRRGQTEHLAPLIETEAGIGVIILLTAAAFTGQPPAADIPVAARSQPSEVLHVFAPKMPQLIPVSITKLNAAAAAQDGYQPSTDLDKSESDFIHNISGLFVIAIGLLALMHALTRARLLSNWPLAFIPFAAFLLVFANPTGWPLGNRGFFEALLSPETLEHRMGTLFPAVLGVCEWRVQTGAWSAARWRYVFPIICGVGGALLLSHSHSLFSDKPTFLIEASHNALGILAVMVGAARWLELRGSPSVSRVAGLIWPVSFVLLGWVLAVYQET